MISIETLRMHCAAIHSTPHCMSAQSSGHTPVPALNCHSADLKCAQAPSAFELGVQLGNDFNASSAPKVRLKPGVYLTYQCKYAIQFCIGSQNAHGGVDCTQDHLANSDAPEFSET